MERAVAADLSVYLFFLGQGHSRERLALATVVEAEESAPQVPGASAVVSAEGLAAGTVGGGAVEAAAIRAARAALARRSSRLLAFDLGNAYSAEAAAVCGGRMRILIDGDPEKHRPAFQALFRAVRAGRSGVLATHVRTRPAAVLRRWFPESFRGWASLSEPWRGCRREVEAAARMGRPVWEKRKAGWLYLEPHAPPPRLLIAGAGHVGRAVAWQGKRLGFEVTVIDDRPELANAEAVPQADRFIVGPAARSLRRLRLGDDAYVVIVTRGHRHDAEALRACLGRKAAYLGMIGSARKIGLMREEFLRRKWAGPEDWDRVHAPIGLPIGSRSVPEIAVSIAAELVAVRRENASRVPREKRPPLSRKP